MKSACSQSTQSLTQYSDMKLRAHKLYQKSPSSVSDRNPHLARVKSAQPHRQKLLTQPTSAQLPPRSAFPENLSRIPLKLYERYLQNSFLANNHNVLLGAISFTSQEAVNHLNTNYYIAQSLEAPSALFEKEPNLLFKMYETLVHLDKEILQALFRTEEKHSTDQIGVSKVREIKPIDNFRFDFLVKAVAIMDDFLSALIHRIEDKTIAVFIEQLWKFWVVVLDVNTQWSQNRYQALLEIQVGQYKKQVEELQNQLDSLNKRYYEKTSGNKLLLVKEQSKVLHMKEENLKLLQQIHEMETKFFEMSNIDNATGDLERIRLKLREIEHSFHVHNREIIHNHKEAASSIRDIGRIYKQSQTRSQTYCQSAFQSLNLLEQFEEINLLSQNPILALLPLSYMQQYVQPKEFIEFACQSLSNHPYTSGPELFCHWADADNARLNLMHQLTKGASEDDLVTLCRMITGIGEKWCVSHKALESVVKLTSVIETHGKQAGSEAKKRPSLVFQDEKPPFSANLDVQIDVKQLEDHIDYQLYESLAHIHTMRVSQFLILALQFYREREQQDWKEFVAKCKTYRIDEKWYHFEHFLYLDSQILWQYVNMKYQSSKQQPESIDSAFAQAYKIWLVRPRFFLKHQPEHADSSQRSPTTKTIAKVQFFKKSQTAGDNSTKRK